MAGRAFLTMAKLTKKKAKEIAYRAIYAWTSEHIRDDTQFFDLPPDESVLNYGFDAENPEHKKLIQKGFIEINEIIRSRYAKLKQKK